ncbi:protein of unknown function [Amycolatopsis pretoriensis]|uniref:DUF4333 domain-containing protein n=1 Tax=Amycolatopsis pretoriensis TaxID=218821 RepID=A0A1H5R221_9PSEU|nr:DUF4333 domain-containing protein [Amycolatopsis pretoriensis]SEF31457.1 protein of unknown function [Amycolatopsis pretoriensis]
MSQPPGPQQPQWWQPPTNPPGPPAGWQEQQATGPHAGQWQQNADPGATSGSYTGQWTPSQQQGSGSFSGPWQPGQPGSGPWQQPGTPSGGQPAPAPAPQPQYGGGFQPAQYGGLGAFPVEPEKKPKSKKPLLITVAVVLVLAIGGGLAWLLGAFRGDVLEQQSLEDGVVKVLNESYGEPDVTNAQCPANEAAQNGTTFDCTVKIGGQDKKVTVRVLNDRPEYEVGAPH